MKMLQAQSCTQISVANRSFIAPKKSLPLRCVGPTFSSNLPQSSITYRHPELVQPKPFPLKPTQPSSSPPPPQPSSSPPPRQPSSSPVGELPSRVYVGYAVYKDKAVLTVSPRPPEFTSLDSGAFKISREGCVLLQFAPSASGRQYDWNRKQVFSLSVGEMGKLISLGEKESCEFFHDPFMGRSEEGKVRKVLKVEPLHYGSGHMFNLSVQNKPENINENIFIPVTKAEFTVFKSLFNFIMPCLLGWNAFASSIKPEVKIPSPRKEDHEWTR